MMSICVLATALFIGKSVNSNCNNSKCMNIYIYCSMLQLTTNIGLIESASSLS